MDNNLEWIVNSVSDAVIITDPLGIIIRMNPAAQRLTGDDVNHATGKQLKELIKIIHTQSGEIFDDVAGIVAVKGEITWKKGDARIITHNNQIFTFSGSAARIHETVNNTESVIILFRDLAHADNSQEILRESEHHYMTLFYKSSIPIILIKLPEVFIVDANEAAENLTGYSKEEMIGKTSVDLGLICRDERNELIGRFRQNDGLKENEMRIMNRRGEVLVVNFRTHPIEINGQLYAFTSMMDITRQTRAEEKLRESEEKYRGLMEAMDSVVATVDYEGIFLYMNEVAAQMLGGTATDFIGKRMHELFPDPVATRQLEGVRQVYRENTGHISESLGFARGEPRWFHNSLQPIRDEIGRVTSVIIHSIDIHEFKTTQQEVEELNRTLEDRIKAATQQIKDLYDNAPTGYHSLDSDGKYVIVNQTELKWLGYTRDEMIGEHVTKFLSRSSRILFRDHFPQYMKTGFLKDFELEFIRKDGSVLPVLVNATLITDSNGKFLISRTVLFDNSERKKAFEALKASERKYRQLFENMTEGFSLNEIIMDENGHVVDYRILEVNEAYEQHSGFQTDKVIGRTIRELVPEADPAFIELLGKVAQTGEPLAYEYFSELMGRYFSIRAFSPQLGKFALIFEDVTKRKKADETLRESENRLRFSRDELSLANVNLEKAARMKDEFLANMSHELRTPLNAILVLSDILEGQYIGSLNERQLKSLKTIRQSAKHLLELINDILDLSKIEAKQLKIDITAVAVMEVCEASFLFVMEAAHKKNIQLDLIPVRGVEIIWADGMRLRQMLINLLTNAIKFTPAGGSVVLEVSADTDEKMIRFIVSDTGIGIAQDDIGRLFQPFVQLESGENRRNMGTGLGLSLVARMAKLHGGSVSVESELGKGSRFTISLPISDLTKPSPANPGSSEDSESLHVIPQPETDKSLVLIAEDNEANIETLSTFLDVLGYRYVVATNGMEAIEEVHRHCPSLILMDLEMPVMDGLEATRRLRSDPDVLIAGIPVIVVTAKAMSGDLDRALAAGADEYLSKPVDLKQLAELIRKYITGKQDS